MEHQIQSIFESTLQGYAQGFRVSQIASRGLKYCSDHEDVNSVFERFPHFDQIPVINENRVIGVLERGKEANSGDVHHNMRPLDDSILVSSEESLDQLLPVLAKPPYYRLVLYGTKVDGIVTRSDVLKLPVRLYGFALVTNLEMLMKEIIVSKYPEDTDWMNQLSEGRQQKVLENKKRFEEKRMDPPLIELTYFCDKHMIIREIGKFSKKFKDDMSKIENNLRNPLAHSTTFVLTDEDFEIFMSAIQKTHEWTKELLNLLN